MEPEPEPEPEPHGLVVVEWNGISGGTTNVTVHCFNPKTNESTILSTFQFSENRDLGGYYFFSSANTSIIRNSIDRSFFSDDFSKLSMCKILADSNGNHAGWLDTNGNFFDVTEALGLQAKSDFDDPVSHYPLGFSNGFFGFADAVKTNNTYNTTCYYVPVDNIVFESIQEGNVKEIRQPDGGELMRNTMGSQRTISDWIDDTHCIVNHYYTTRQDMVDSEIVDLVNQTVTKYIPGDSRSNWNGMVSPDGAQIAFLSKTGNRHIYDGDIIDLYIVPISGGDPVKVTQHSFNLGRTSFLIDWI